MLRRLIQKGNAFFNIDWRVIPFQPVLYTFLLGASLRLTINKTTPPNFDLIAKDFYHIWLGMGIVGPLLGLWSWFWVIKRSGLKRFIGMWLRFASDITVLTMLLSYHVVTVHTNPITESRIFARYIVGAATMFVIILIIRDIWTLVITEKLAGRIHRGDNE